MSHPDLLLDPALPRRPGRARASAPRRSRAIHRRRAARSQPDATLLRRLWDEHAIKAGMIGFYAWFAVANWGAVRDLIARVV